MSNEGKTKIDGRSIFGDDYIEKVSLLLPQEQIDTYYKQQYILKKLREQEKEQEQKLMELKPKESEIKETKKEEESDEEIDKDEKCINYLEAELIEEEKTKCETMEENRALIDEQDVKIDLQNFNVFDYSKINEELYDQENLFFNFNCNK